MVKQNPACATAPCQSTPTTPTTPTTVVTAAGSPLRIATGDLVPMLTDATRAYYFDHADAAIKSVTVAGAAAEVAFPNARVDDYLSALEGWIDCRYHRRRRVYGRQDSPPLEECGNHRRACVVRLVHLADERAACGLGISDHGVRPRGIFNQPRLHCS